MIRPGSALTKQVKVVAPKVPVPGKKTEVSKPDLFQFLEQGDYVGAMVLLEFERKTQGERTNLLMWLAYAAFHNGDYQKSLDIYTQIIEREVSSGEKNKTDGQKPKPNVAKPIAGIGGNAASDKFDPVVYAYQGICHYALCQYEEAEAAAKKAPADNPLVNRLIFHTAHKRNDDVEMMKYHQLLTDSTEDQIGLAAIQYLRSHFQEATDIYKRLLVENREHWALNVYIALCYYKLDYYDVALEILQTYLATPHGQNSITAVNLKSCAHYQLYNGRAAEAELKALQQNSNVGEKVFQDNDILRHNLIVFRNGENAMRVLPPLIEVIPEARLNLVIYYLRTDEVNEAYNLMKDLEPSVPREYILKGVVFAALGQKTGSREHLKLAQQLFQLVGASASECDTIPGRQCMASCFFLLRQFEDVLVYLKSIKAYFANDDDFHWNYGLTCAATGDYKEGKEALLLVQNEKYRAEFVYLSNLSRCYIMCGEPMMAWEAYLRMETSNDSFNLLHLIANDCYKMGHFYHSCKAFDTLERLDPDPEFWEGKRGAAVGVFQKVIAGQESPERLQEIVNLLRNTNNPQVEYMINRVMKKWAKENRVKLE